MSTRTSAASMKLNIPICSYLIPERSSDPDGTTATDRFQTALMGFLFAYTAEPNCCASRSNHGPAHVVDAVVGDIEELLPVLNFPKQYIYTSPVPGHARIADLASRHPTTTTTAINPKLPLNVILGAGSDMLG